MTFYNTICSVIKFYDYQVTMKYLLEHKCRYSEREEGKRGGVAWWSEATHYITVCVTVSHCVVQKAHKDFTY